MEINLSAEERELLLQLVAESLADLRAEIHATDNREYKFHLKLKEQIVRTLVEKLEHVAYAAET